jgi:hypothetical protein
MKVKDYLEDFKKRHDEETFQAEVTRLALQAIRKGGKHAEFWKPIVEDSGMDWDSLVQLSGQDDAPSSPDMMMADLLRRQMPGIKSQAQYDAVVGAMEATQHVLSAILEGNEGKATKAREALEAAFTAASQATELTARLEEVPEAATSEAAEAFKQAPAQFVEGDVSQELLSELEGIDDLSTLNTWYADTKERRSKVVTSSLRNELLDAIRAKNSALRG